MRLGREHRQGYLYTNQIGFFFRAPALDAANRISRAAQEAARRAIVEHPETLEVDGVALNEHRVRADESNYAPRRKGAT